MQSYTPLFRGYIYNILQEINTSAKDCLYNTVSCVNIFYIDYDFLFINIRYENKLQIINIKK